MAATYQISLGLSVVQENSRKKVSENPGMKSLEKCESRKVTNASEQLVGEAGQPELDGDTTGFPDLDIQGILKGCLGTSTGELKL